ncbi:MAG: hypothetical protein EA406_09570 [Rhodospirillales bacterium]|nr:MAG: hypothetical protein EA406_09570 [Rhodospirillales bacterium]
MFPTVSRAEATTDRYDPAWARTTRGRYYRLVHLDPEAENLAGAGGVLVVWHAGFWPAWVYVASARDLAHALHDLANNDDVMSYETNGGLFVTWSFLRPEYRDGVVTYLLERLRPKVLPASPPVQATPIPVLSPTEPSRSL